MIKGAKYGIFVVIIVEFIKTRFVGEMKKVIICFFCLMFAQNSFGYVKVKSLGTSSSSGSSSYYNTGGTYAARNTYNTSYNKVPTKNRISTVNHVGASIATPVVMKSTVKKIGNAFTTTPNNYYATTAQIDALDSLINNLESQIGNFQTGLDEKPNITDVYTKTEVDDKIDAISTNGTPGADGLSAYQIAVNNGFTGSETEWVASLKGVKGDQGDKGDPGESTPFGCASGDGSYLISVSGGITNCKYVELTSDNFVE